MTPAPRGEEVTVDDARALLERAPRIMRSLYEGLPDAWLHANVPGEWSAHSVLVHVVQVEDHAWVERIAHLLESPGSRLPGVDPGGPDDTRSVDEMLDRFEGLREANLRKLATMDVVAVPGVHHALGQVTSDQILATWAIHDLNHQAQAMAAIASRYRNAVGPFITFLGILGPPG